MILHYIWLPNAHEVPYTEKDLNPIYKTDSYCDKKYDLEVYKKFDAWCQRYGWYASTENFTMQIFKV